MAVSVIFDIKKIRIKAFIAVQNLSVSNIFG